VNEDEARRLLSEQFPDLPVERIAGPRSGTSNECFLVNGHWVFRFPKHAEADGELRTELLCLPRLWADGRLPLPRFAFFGKPSPAFGFHFVGYPVIRGRRLDRELLASLSDEEREAVARGMGRFLTLLHGHPLGELRAAMAEQGLAMPQSIVGWTPDAGQEFRGMAEARFAEHRDDPDFPRLYALYERLVEGLAGLPQDQVLLHADLSEQHVLYDEERRDLAGVIDFGNVCEGDSFVDFMNMTNRFGLDFARLALRHYDRPAGALIEEKLAKFRFFHENRHDFRRLLGWASSS
jgi:aminoglycoside 2''-phosphotransferase